MEDDGRRRSSGDVFFDALDHFPPADADADVGAVMLPTGIDHIFISATPPAPAKDAAPGPALVRGYVQAHGDGGRHQPSRFLLGESLHSSAGGVATGPNPLLSAVPQLAPPVGLELPRRGHAYGQADPPGAYTALPRHHHHRIPCPALSGGGGGGGARRGGGGGGGAGRGAGAR